MKWTVYILRCADGTLYTGITNDLARRLECHSAGRGAKFTRGRGPFSVVYNELCDSKSLALKREIAIKAMSRPEKLRLTS